MADPKEWMDWGKQIAELLVSGMLGFGGGKWASKRGGNGHSKEIAELGEAVEDLRKAVNALEQAAAVDRNNQQHLALVLRDLNTAMDQIREVVWRVRIKLGHLSLED